MKLLASDSLKGRGNFSPELHQSARFIAGEFQKYGLLPLLTGNDYFQPFSLETIAQKDQKDSLGQYNPRHILLNVIGVIPGKSKPKELVIFSAHYDHMGVIKEWGNKDSIMNGANDNASGTAALLSLAHYYSLRMDNERTLVFCAFAGEELGLKGSAVFAGRMKPETIKAVINIEMIGRTNLRQRAFFITGANYSNLDVIMKRNIPKKTVRIVHEPSDSKGLFSRSDNYSFARLGIPAHSIMSSDDDDACYHQVCDELERIDFENMVQIIKAITQGCQTIITGEDTPSRVKEYGQ
jgi:Zn-dependent M28 family amino/carboxypeptidase